MDRLPIYFGQHFHIMGRAKDGADLMLRVYMDGRCLLVEDKPEELGARWWAYGVNPGGVAGSGDTQGEAMRDLLDRINSLLVDFAEESYSLADFRERLDRFVQQTNEPELEDWQAAREEVRAGRVDAEGYRKVTADKPPSAQVQLFVSQAQSATPETVTDGIRYEALTRTGEEVHVAAAAA